jgi:uncharacterized membrane protein YccC
MLHMRRDWASQSLAVFAAPIAAIWDRVIAADPGLLRLLMAVRGTSAVFLTTVASVLLGKALGAPPIEFAAGITLSLIAPFLMREPTRRQRQRTLLALALPAAAASVATTLLHGHGPLGDCFFLVLVFACFLLQARGPFAIGQGLVAVVTSYIGLYLELPPSSLPIQILSVVMALPVTAFACFVLFPLRPAATLRRMVQAVQARAARVLRDARFVSDGAPGSARRLYHSLARLNEAALAADDQLGVLDAAGSLPLRHHLMDLELGAAQLANCPLAGLTGRHAARLQVTEQRLRQGRWSARDLREADEAAPSAALAAITRAAAALDSAAALTAAPHADKPAPPPGPLAWRIALRVTLASALAMAGGMMLSPNRWFWAVITVYVVFLNTRSRGDTIYKGVQRMCGTLIGLAAGVALADLLRGDIRTEAVVVFAAIFGLYYLYQISYTLGIMCVTVLLGVLYSLLGAAMGPLLVLRLEETVIGAVAAIVVAVCVMPLRTRDQVARSGAAELAALAEAIGACRRVLAGDTGASPLAAMRAVDRQMADLRLAILPLTVGRSVLRRAAAERPVEALMDCVYWTRVLAVNAAGPDPEAAALADRLERRVAALAAGQRGVLAEPPTPAGQTALDQLDRATAALAERLAIGALHGFRVES